MNKVISEPAGKKADVLQQEQFEMKEKKRAEEMNDVSWVEWEQVSFITFISDIYDIIDKSNISMIFYKHNFQNQKKPEDKEEEESKDEEKVGDPEKVEEAKDGMVLEGFEQNPTDHGAHYLPQVQIDQMVSE